ncbi:general substrate transporter [Mycena amicta]|nr:general substrate transporter [Mycena amicta]KAJ7066061.1 general substrate transporter [Mycena amicta]
MSRSSSDKEDISRTEDVKDRPGMTVEERALQRQIQLEKALQVDPGPSVWSWVAVQMYLITLVACCCSGDSGFDGTVMGGINSMKQYQAYFHMSSVGAKTGIVFGIYTIGQLCGTVPAMYIPDRFGRRAAMFFGNFFILAGAFLTANAQSKAQFIGGRFLTGFGGSCGGAAAKAFMAELAPPKSRGAYMGFLNSFYYVGQIAATGMMVSTGAWSSELSWRLPLYIQAVPAGLNVLLVYSCPESPRWMYSIGKEAECRKTLTRLHSSNNDENSPLIELEMEEIREHIQVHGADKTWWDFRPLFRTRANRHRTYLVAMIGAFGQLSGNGLITYFLPVLLNQAGIHDQHKVLTLNFVNSVTSYIGALSGTFIVDRVGRRFLTLAATALCVMCLTIVTGLVGSGGGGSAGSSAGIAFVYLFMVFFSFGWTPMQALYPAEILSYQARAKGLGFLGIVVQAASCINTFGMPVALQKLTWKVYLIFLIWDVFELIMVYFFMVEPKGLSLEEIDSIFEAPKPVAYSINLVAEARARALKSNY